MWSIFIHLSTLHRKTLLLSCTYTYKFGVNYKFCLLCLHQIAGAVLLAKSLQAVSLTFQNLASFVL
ncbi:hypothetical protein Hanom_Chr02g00144151 [Helianthus anomalus]